MSYQNRQFNEQRNVRDFAFDAPLPQPETAEHEQAPETLNP